MEQAIGLTIYFVAFSLIRVITAIFLLKLAFTTKLKQLYILSMQIFLGALVNLMRFLLYSLAAEIFIIIELFFLAIFIHMTFYKDKRSPVYLILPLVVILRISSILLGFLPQVFYISLILANIGIIMLGMWITQISTSAYLKIMSIKVVEPWVKVRYLLVIVFGMSWIIAGIIFIFTPDPAFVDSIGSLILRVTFIIMDLSSFVAWAMPSVLKKWLNRKYPLIEKSVGMSEEEIMKQFRGKKIN